MNLCRGFRHGVYDVDEWLASIGLAGRVAAFRTHGVLREQLGELTDADLRELGLTIGERKRFLRAVLADGFLDLRSRLPAERRPLSMMFVDVVGSSRLAEELAPEDLMELLRRYGDFCAGPILRYGGRIARMVGDGLLAYFCFPVANENDPERAVRAALDITRGIGAIEVPGGEALAVRIGIATGPVVVGDLRTAGGTYRHTVVGAAPNLAARLQGLVPPGGIAIGEATYLRVGDRFVCADLGSFELRGMARPHSVWQVLREVATQGRVVRPRAGRLYGRADELGVLQAAWARARRGEGGIVVLSGEPGMGKSRLLQAFLQESGDGAESAGTILFEGSAFETDSVLRPAIAWLQRQAGGFLEDAAGGIGAGLRDWDACAPALAGLPGIAPGAAPADAPAGTPEQVREATLAALSRLLLAQAEDRPLRLVLEDVHWFDPTTLELVSRLAAALEGRRVLLLLAVRSDFALLPALGWTALPEAAVPLRLDRLAEAAVADLAAAMLPGRSVSPVLLRAIHRKAGGVPLFVEEVVRTLAARDEADLPDADGEAPLIPASVHELLAGRLDRLGEAKEVAQAASVIGPEIRRDVLARVCAAQFATAPAVLEEALDALVQAGVLAESEDGRRASSFTHALLRDAAYDSLLRAPRQALHRQVAAALLACEPDLAATRPEIMALHLTEGADAEAALPHWLAAGRLSLARSALTEATRLLGRGLAAMQALPPTPALVERRLEFMTLLGPAVMALHGYGSPEAARLYGEANAMVEALPEAPRNFPIYWGWWRVSRDYDHKLERAHLLVSRARQRRDPELQLQAHHCAWASEFFVGNYARCCEHIEAGLEIYEAHDVRHHMHLYGGHDAKVCGHGEMALASWMMGRPVSARRHDQFASDHVERLGHVGSAMHLDEIALVRHASGRDIAKALRLGYDMIRRAGEHGMQDARAKGMIFVGWATAIGSDPAAGLRLLEEGFARQRDIGTSEDFPIYVALQAEMLMAAGEPERAMQALREADAEFDRSGLRFWRPELRRLQAEALLRADPRGGAGSAGEPARALFEDAIAIAQEQGAAMLGLRAATALARLDGSGASFARLRECLFAVAEDDGGPDVAAARALAFASADATGGGDRRR